MIRKNREVNVFSLSMLDVLCGALGAVLIVLAVLSTRPEETVEDLRPLVEKLEAEKKSLENRLAIRRPIAVQIWWAEHEDQDIDLYLRMEGRDAEPDLTTQQWPRYTGDARINSRNRARSETWLMRDVPVGRYEVYVKLMGEPSRIRSTLVWGWYHLGWSVSDRTHPMGYITLDRTRRLVRLGTLDLGRDGKLTLELGPNVKPIKT